jgi:hypothetical protein
MESLDFYLNELVNENKKKFRNYPQLKWANSYNTAAATDKREELLTDNSKSLFKGTKPFYHSVSMGCNICGEGKWSCLFITGQCNAKCFYCPTRQNQDEDPATQNLIFDKPDDYAEYINRFGFKGVSFSGGEPFLKFERLMDFLTTVRKKCAPNIYIWAYTNGILVTEEKLKQLASAGLNELRFDIGATGYNLENLRKAKGIIPVVTVEIPAVPESKQKLKELLPEMIKYGVKHLNLHQLRLTTYNVEKLSMHDYTYIPAEQPIVMESELAALEIIDYARRNDLQIGINYCSFSFKNRFQKAGFRTMVAQSMLTDKERLTEKGFIRQIEKNRLSYFWCKLEEEQGRGSHSTKGLFSLGSKHIKITRHQAVPDIVLSDEELSAFYNLIHENPRHIPGQSLLFKIWQMEYIERGLRDYC